MQLRILSWGNDLDRSYGFSGAVQGELVCNTMHTHLPPWDLCVIPRQNYLIKTTRLGQMNITQCNKFKTSRLVVGLGTCMILRLGTY